VKDPGKRLKAAAGKALEAAIYEVFGRLGGGKNAFLRIRFRDGWGAMTWATEPSMRARRPSLVFCSSAKVSRRASPCRSNLSLLAIAWFCLYRGLPLAEVLTAIETDGHLHPL
jgi:hypothetical protein